MTDWAPDERGAAERQPFKEGDVVVYGRGTTTGRVLGRAGVGCWSVGWTDDFCCDLHETRLRHATPEERAAYEQSQAPA